MNPNLAPARALRELRYQMRYLVSLYPAVYFPYARRRYPGTGIEVFARNTELVIEAFGRSGSSFAVDAFELVQRRPIRIAHHTHAAAQVIAGAKLRIPTLVIVREPGDATTAAMARRSIRAKPALLSWIRYHERILPWRGRFLAVRFEEITADFGAVTRALNERFGTNYDVFDHTPENEARVFQIIEARNRNRDTGAEDPATTLARPTPEREARKRIYLLEYESEALRGMRARASRAYQALFSNAVAAS